MKKLAVALCLHSSLLRWPSRPAATTTTTPTRPRPRPRRHRRTRRRRRQASGGAGTLKVTAEPSESSPAPDEAEGQGGHGDVTSTTLPRSHDIEIEGKAVEEKSELVADGTATVTADLEPGDVQVLLHGRRATREAGMEETLTVK